MKRISAGVLAIIAIVLLVLPSCSKNSYKTPASGGGSANTVNINQMKFTPNSITVTAGTTVTWTNTDNMTHTVTSTTGVFNSGNLSSGNNFSFKFTTAGTYPYKCTIHPFMTGTVIVN
ncbi:MAG TPA: cupredoxin family copper-binding protein [Flavipsychrobacter sp.]|nr:cupredoxin family copper-binding protein [Flavipsychrobacter sp.]